MVKISDCFMQFVDAGSFTMSSKIKVSILASQNQEGIMEISLKRFEEKSKDKSKGTNEDQGEIQR